MLRFKEAAGRQDQRLAVKKLSLAIPAAVVFMAGQGTWICEKITSKVILKICITKLKT